jgi:DNA ligase D-like protein (predicted 3'-phosphoesterase)
VASTKLAAYRAKRDFRITAEPSDEAVAAVSERRRFVIQKHAATRLHYDLRLEHEGVFLSWAVMRGPSLDPHDKRLAVEVEPHPLAYGDFEGTIPKGQYGGGTVMLWDRGYWAPEPGFDHGEEGLKQGELKLRLRRRAAARRLRPGADQQRQGDRRQAQQLAADQAPTTSSPRKATRTGSSPDSGCLGGLGPDAGPDRGGQ